MHLESGDAEALQKILENPRKSRFGSRNGGKTNKIEQLERRNAEKPWEMQIFWSGNANLGGSKHAHCEKPWRTQLETGMQRTRLDRRRIHVEECRARNALH